MTFVHLIIVFQDFHRSDVDPNTTKEMFPQIDNLLNSQIFFNSVQFENFHDPNYSIWWLCGHTCIELLLISDTTQEMFPQIDTVCELLTTIWAIILLRCSMFSCKMPIHALNIVGLHLTYGAFIYFPFRIG